MHEASSFSADNLRYTGYQTYEDMMQRVFNFSADYTVTNKVDQSIINKVTHEPKDYGKVTATPAFDADCFVYEVMEGSSIVTGFSQTGYDKIHSFTMNDCISIKLPEQTPAGETVEGFCARRGNGGYSVSEAFDDAAPCVVLVCPDSYTKFYGFRDNTANYKVQNVVLGTGINMLANRAFLGCVNIKTVTIPEGVDTIPEYTFENCKNLVSVTIPQGVSFIKEKAFAGCEKLTTAAIPEGIQEIGNRAFEGCNSFVIAKLEISGKKIGECAFSGATIEEITFTENGFTSSHRNNWGTIYSQWQDAHVKKITIGPDIVRIPDYAFEYCAEVTEVTLPEGVTEIGPAAFNACSALQKVVLPDGLTVIADEAFLKCEALKTINVPADLKTVGNSAFQNCTALVLASFDMSGKTIGIKAFEGVTFQKLALSTEEYASSFYTNWGTPMAPWDGAIVKEIEIGEAVKKIPDYAFAYCQGLTDVILPETVEEIGKSAFQACSSLKSVTFGSGLRSICDGAFLECTSLKTAEIPAAVGTIGTEAFKGCNSLVIENFELGGRKIGTYAFEQVTINKVTLSSNAFESLRYSSWGTVYSHWMGVNVKEIEIAKGVTELPDYAFEYIGTVAEITVPDTVTKIGAEAFGNCSNLRKLHLPASVKDISDNAMVNCSDVTIYAPEGSAGKKFADGHGFFFKAE